MIFRDCEAVRNGRKTHTRRPQLEGERRVIRDGKKTVLGQSGRIKWQVGRTYAVQSGRGVPGQGRFKLLDIREESLQDISGEDAIAEGWPEHRELFPGVNREWKALEWFRRLWDDIWKRRPDFQWAANPTVWVLVIRWNEEVWACCSR